jgi:hypothetical protein
MSIVHSMDNSTGIPDKAPVRRTMNYTVQEDLMIAQAYIAASEDSTTGNYQKGTVFFATMGGIYKDLCINHCKEQHNSLANSDNNIRRTNPMLMAPLAFALGTNTFLIRTGESIFKRFKATIAKACTIMCGLTTNYPLLSGKSDSQYWGRLMGAFLTKTGATFKFAKVYEFLKDLPKWEEHCKLAKSDKERNPVRPRGLKSAKRIADNKARSDHVIEKVMGAMQQPTILRIMWNLPFARIPSWDYKTFSRRPFRRLCICWLCKICCPMARRRTGPTAGPPPSGQK